MNRKKSVARTWDTVVSCVYAFSIILATHFRAAKLKEQGPSFMPANFALSAEVSYIHQLWNLGPSL